MQAVSLWNSSNSREGIKMLYNNKDNNSIDVQKTLDL